MVQSGALLQKPIGLTYVLYTAGSPLGQILAYHHKRQR